MDKASALVKENSPEHRDDLFFAVKELKGARAKALAVYAGSSYVKASCVGSRAKAVPTHALIKRLKRRHAPAVKREQASKANPRNQTRNIRPRPSANFRVEVYGF